MKNEKKTGSSKNSKKQQQKALRRHRRFYSFLWHTFRKPIEWFFGCDLERAPKIEGNYLLMSNHNTDFDFLFTGISMKEHMYFVISEHTMQHGFASSLLRYFVAPISRLKGSTAASTAMTIIRTLRGGTNVCIFAEGNRSFNGETCPILPSTGKLARSTGASLVTYRLEGGYMLTPRWGYSLRKGRLQGRIVNIYSPEQLRAMSDDEVNEIICRDLYENAYERQSEWNAPYKGKRLAEGLEHILFICPECGGISTLSAKNSTLSCTCGMKGTFDKYGYLNGTPYRTVLEWDRWQQERLPELIAAAEDDDAVIFADDGISLIQVDSDHNASVLGTGRLTVSRRAISICGRQFPLSEMEGGGLAIYGHANTVFNHGGEHYELRSERRWNAVKYTRVYELVTAQASNDTKKDEASAAQ